MGASTRLARLSAQRIENGGQGEAGPTLAAQTQASAGIANAKWHCRAVNHGAFVFHDLGSAPRRLPSSDSWRIVASSKN